MDSKRGEHINLEIAWLEDDYRGGISRYLDRQSDLGAPTLLRNVSMAVRGTSLRKCLATTSSPFWFTKSTVEAISQVTLELSNKHLLIESLHVNSLSNPKMRSIPELQHPL